MPTPLPSEPTLGDVVRWAKDNMRDTVGGGTWEQLEAYMPLVLDKRANQKRPSPSSQSLRKWASQRCQERPDGPLMDSIPEVSTLRNLSEGIDEATGVAFSVPFLAEASLRSGGVEMSPKDSPLVVLARSVKPEDEDSAVAILAALIGSRVKGGRSRR